MDELIKRLRNRRICIQQSGSLDDFPLLVEAADAIEELKKLHETQKKNLSVITDAYMKSWIPVTERLPEKNGPYLCCWKVSADEKKHIARIMVWRADTGWMNVWDEPMNNYVTHWMPLPEPPKEG